MSAGVAAHPECAPYRSQRGKSVCTYYTKKMENAAEFSRSQRRGRRRYAGHLSAISNFATLPKNGNAAMALQYTRERRESDKQKLQKTPAKTPAADTYSTTAFQQKDVRAKEGKRVSVY